MKKQGLTYITETNNKNKSIKETVTYCKTDPVEVHEEIVEKAKPQAFNKKSTFNQDMASLDQDLSTIPVLKSIVVPVQQNDLSFLTASSIRTVQKGIRLRKVKVVK